MTSRLSDAYPLRRLSFDGQDIPLSAGTLRLTVDRDTLSGHRWRIEATALRRRLWAPNVVEVEAETAQGDVIAGQGVAARIYGRRVRVESAGEWRWR